MARKAKQQSQSFAEFILGCVDFARKIGNEPKERRYISALSKWNKFECGRRITLDDITLDVAEAWEEWLKQTGICPNTIGFYNRTLRALYNKACARGLCEDRRPWRHSDCRVERTAKRAIPIAKVKQIAHMDLSQQKRSVEQARDMFMLSFYLRGISWIDLAGLKKSDLQGDNIVYRRSKTRQRLVVRLEPPARKLVERYLAPPESDYLLRIIRADRQTDFRKQARSALCRINTGLHEVGRLAGTGPLTMYVARHSWASACKASNIPLSVISEGMGHDSEETTRIYLASLDTGVVDKANRKIIKLVV